MYEKKFIQLCVEVKYSSSSMFNLCINVFSSVQSLNIWADALCLI